MRSPEEITTLFKKYIEGLCSEEETEVIFELLAADEYEFIFKDLIDVELTEQVEDTFKASLEVKAALAKTREKILLQIDDNNDKRGMLNSHKWLKYAAAVLLLCVGVALLFTADQLGFDKQRATADITPGGNKAILTLADGSEVVLDGSSINGNLSNHAGIRIDQTEDGKLVYTVNETKEHQGQEKEGDELTNTISTPRGGQYQVNLPDGTKVWLNAESVLKFPLSFAKQKQRLVELQGEAYFEVAKMMVTNEGIRQRMPFVVKTGTQDVEVLGTHFNINAYVNNKEVKTTLVEGAVRVKPLNGLDKDQKVLKPGQQSLLPVYAEKIKVIDIDPLTEIAWKNGQFFFDNQSIESIMQEVARWYDVEVVFQDDLSGKTVWGSVTRYANVTEVLSTLELTGNIHFKVEGRRITVHK